MLSGAVLRQSYTLGRGSVCERQRKESDGVREALKVCVRAHACEKVVRMCVGECVCAAFVNESVREKVRM